MSLRITKGGLVPGNLTAMSGAQTGQLRILDYEPFPIQSKLLNGAGDLASKCLRPRWKRTASFCG